MDLGCEASTFEEVNFVLSPSDSICIVPKASQAVSKPGRMALFKEAAAAPWMECTCSIQCPMPFASGSVRGVSGPVSQVSQKRKRSTIKPVL